MSHLNRIFPEIRFKKIAILLLLFFSSLTQIMSSQTLGGTVSSPDTVCAGTNLGILTISSYFGTLLRWEYSNTLTGPWISINNTSNSIPYNNLSQTTFFRAITQYSTFAEISSNTVEIYCRQPLPQQQINAVLLQCMGSPSIVTLSPPLPSGVTWQYSKNNWVSAINFGAQNSNSATLPNEFVPYQVHAIIDESPCPFSLSNVLQITPVAQSTPGSISGLSVVCASGNTFTLNLSGYFGDITQWESSNFSTGPFVPISNTSNQSQLPILNLNQTNYIRVLVQSGNCPITYSPTHTITVNPVSNGGIISAQNSVCAVSNGGNLFLNGQIGQVVQWEQSNTATNWSISAVTTPTFSFNNLLATRYFRAKIQSGVCPPAYSNTHTLTVHPLAGSNYTVANQCQYIGLPFVNSTSNSVASFWKFGDGNTSNVTAPSHTYQNAGTYQTQLISTTSFGCIDSAQRSLTIYPQPSTSFTSPDTSCHKSSLTFINTSTISSGAIISRLLNFGDANSVSNFSVLSYSYATPATYTAFLTTISNFNCSHTFTRSIQIFPQPQAQFSATSTCEGNSTLFQNQSTISTGTIRYRWLFGNGDTSNVFQPNYQFLQSGNYQVSLQAKSDHNCNSQIQHPIRIHPRPLTNLSASNTCVGSIAPVQTTINPLTNSSTFQLNYGDGTIVSTLLSAHIYTQAGIYQILFSVQSDSGCVASKSTTLQIFAKPSASFAASSACTGDSILFINQSQVSVGTLHYEWRFDSLGTSTVSSPKKNFPYHGIYLNQLIAITDANCRDTVNQPLVIYEVPKMSFIAPSSCEGTIVQFTNTSQISNAKIENTVWQFGDSLSSTIEQPKHTYTLPQIYTIQLKGFTNEGCIATTQGSIEIFARPTASFTTDKICANENVTFRNLSRINYGAFYSVWRFDQIENDSNFQCQHVFQQSGPHHAQLVVYSAHGCSDSTSLIVSVLATPSITIHADSIVDAGAEQLISCQGASSYTWFPPDFLSDPFSGKTNCKPSDNISYQISYSSEEGCRGWDSLRINVRKEYHLEIFNLLSPDNNGLNDTWVIRNIEAYPSNQVVVFDQWNQIVFEKTNYQNTWSGTNQRGELLPTGTYFYQISFSGTDKKYTGTLSLLLTD
jgi:gliding motility-associated-like protein